MNLRRHFRQLHLRISAPYRRKTLAWAMIPELNVPVRFSGEGRIRLGARVALGFGLAPRSGSGQIEIQARHSTSRISIGSDVEVSNSTTIIGLTSVTIEDFCLIGDHCLIMDSDFHDSDPECRLDLSRRATSDGRSAPVWIGRNVWIGSHCIILKGVQIGEGAVVGAGSVVRRSIPSNTIFVG